MKVKDLILKLKEFPEDMDVVIDSVFDFHGDLELLEMTVKKCISFETPDYLSQQSYEAKLEDAELDGDYVDEKVIYIC